MCTCRITGILLSVLIMASCNRNVATQLDGTPMPDSVDSPSGITDVSPTGFDGVTKLKRESSGAVSLLQGDNLSLAIEGDPEYRRLIESRSYAELAIEFVHFFRMPFQLEDPKRELSVTRVQEDDLGFHQVRLLQNYKSVNVMHSEIIVHFDRDDHVYLFQGQYIPTPVNMSLKPKMALNAVAESIKGHGDVSVDRTSAGPFILPMSDAHPKLVFQLRSRLSLTNQSILLIDANNGEIVRKLPTIYNAN